MKLLGSLIINFENQYRFKNFLDSLKSANLGLNYCSDSPKMEELKAILYYKLAYAEQQLNFPLRSRETMLQAADLVISIILKPNLQITVFTR